MYFVPHFGGAGSILARYDTLAAFADVASWAAFDTTRLGAKVMAFTGAVFDGKSLYLAPHNGGLAARFEAKSPPSLPRGYSGSFF